MATNALSQPDLVQAVKVHAKKHYNVDGWDLLVECYDDAEIAEAIGQSKTARAAIAAVRRELAPHADRRLDIQLERF